MGAHKAFLFARTLSAYDVSIASELDSEVLSKCQMIKRDPQEAIDQWVKDSPRPPTVAVIPNANTTYFYHANL